MQNEIRASGILHSAFLILHLAIAPWAPGAIAPAAEDGGFLLLVQPPQELLKPGIGQDSLHGVERVPQFIMAPGLVDEILAGVARRHDFGPALAARDDMVASRGHLPLTKDASHTKAECRMRSAECKPAERYVRLASTPLFTFCILHSPFIIYWPLAGLFHRLTPRFFPNRHRRFPDGPHSGLDRCPPW